MKTLNKNDLSKIESIFSELKNGNSDGKSSLKELENILNNTYNKSFKVVIISSEKRRYSFVMSVIPEKSIIDKVTNAVANDKTKTDTMVDIWKKCKNWLVEIDSRILDKTFTDRELTALLLHEIGHVIDSDSIPKRIIEVVQYGIVSSSFEAKSLLKKKMFCLAFCIGIKIIISND